MDILQIILFGLVVVVTHFAEGITGFGCTVLALPFCISLAGVKIAVPVLIVVAWLLALYIIIIDFKNIVWKEYLVIVSFVILGLPIGIWMFGNLPESGLKKLLGVFMIIVAIRGLYTAVRPKPEMPADSDGVIGKVTEKEKLKKYLYYFALFFGGIIHGAFGSGGPFIVIYAAKALPDKSKFRATLCTIWFTLNSVIIFQDIKGGVLIMPVLKLILYSLPFLAVGIILGNYAHKKIKGEAFVKFVYGVLLVSGVFMVL